jgi:hypothetical protein
MGAVAGCTGGVIGETGELTVGIDLGVDGEPKYPAWLWLSDDDVKENVGVGVMGTALVGIWLVLVFKDTEFIIWATLAPVA